MAEETKPETTPPSGDNLQPEITPGPDASNVTIPVTQSAVIAAQLATASTSSNKSQAKAMKTPQGLNNAMFSLNMTAILLGIKENSELKLDATLAFTVFFILLRIKIYLDDSNFLEDGRNDDRPAKKWGYFTSILTWILFSFSAYRINTKPELSFWFFIAAIVVSSIWLVPIQIKVKLRDKKHNAWMLSNLAYVAGALMLLYTDRSDRNTDLLIFGFLFLVLLADAFASKPMENF